MRKRAVGFLVATLLALSLGACFSRGTKPPAEEMVAIGACNPFPCARMKVSDVPPLPESLPAAVRERISSQVAEVLYAPLDEGVSEFTYDALLAQLEARQREFITENLSNAPLDWVLERKASVLFSNDDVITVDVTNIGYFGGAHGFDERALLSFDRRDGRRLSLGDLIGDGSTAILQQIAEAEFRRTRGIPVGRSLQDEGFFLVSGEPFRISQNFGVVAGGILLHYNPYEIGPYVMGKTDVVLPREAIAPLLKDGALRIAHIFDSVESQR
jgi:hypothetical protein